MRLLPERPYTAAADELAGGALEYRPVLDVELLIIVNFCCQAVPDILNRKNACGSFLARQVTFSQ